MFCKNCGEKLESPNQKFCANCGSVVSNPPATPQAPQAPQLKAEHYKAPSADWPVPDYKFQPIEVGEPGPHSKRSLAFAIVSLALAAVGYGFGGSNFIRTMMPYPYSNGFGGVPGLVIGVIFNITGLIFGILAKTNSSKARSFEPINTLRKVGGVFAVFGIVINTIPLAIIFIIVVFPILVIWFIFF